MVRGEGKRLKQTVSDYLETGLLGLFLKLIIHVFLTIAESFL